MDWDVLGGDRKHVKEGFRQVKKDVLALHDRFSCIEEELKRLQDQIKELQKDRKSSEEDRTISYSQPIPSVPELGRMIEEIIGKALKDHNTKAAEVVPEIIPAGTEQIVQEPELKEVQMPKPEATPINHEHAQDRLKEDLLKTYERNRKNIVKQQILGELRKGGATKIDLRDIVVDQKRYCSRSAFYRYLDELELEGLVDFERKKGRDVLISVSQQ